MIQNGLIVQARGLAKTYEMGANRIEALRNVDLDVQRGQFVGVMGVSGSGKSTLLHLLGCLDVPSQGTYHLAGQDVSSLDDRQLSLIRATKIGFIFQTFNLVPHCTVMENVTMPFLYRKVQDFGAVAQKAETAIERVGLGARKAHKPSELSGGEMQRAAIARALVIDPLLILADEPTGNLDTATGREILALFRELNEQGVTMVIVTHDEHVSPICHRVVWLRDGTIVGREDKP